MTNYYLPTLHGNWIDLVILLVIIFYVWEGIRRGFILGVIDLGGFILSFLISLKTYRLTGNFLAENFTLPSGLANAAGFLINGALIELLCNILANTIHRKLYPFFRKIFERKRLLGYFIWSNRLLGILPALGETLIFCAFLLTLFVSLPIQGAIKKDITSSKIGGPIVAKTQGVERQLNKIFGEAVNESLTFLTINSNPTISEKVDLGFTQNEVKIDEAAEEQMLILVNQERTAKGLPKLSGSAKLKEVARSHGKDMFAKGFFSHYNPAGLSPFDRMNQAHIEYTAAGENLALAPNVSFAHQGLMNSPGHRTNILSSDFGKVGIGIIDGGIYGEIFVQEFTN